MGMLERISQYLGNAGYVLVEHMTRPMSQYWKFVGCVGQKCNCEDVDSELVEKNGEMGKRKKEIYNEEWATEDQDLMPHNVITPWLPRFYQRGIYKSFGTHSRLQCCLTLPLNVFQFHV